LQAKYLAEHMHAQEHTTRKHCEQEAANSIILMQKALLERDQAMAAEQAARKAEVSSSSYDMHVSSFAC
jgi:hypothetical protein